MTTGESDAASGPVGDERRWPRRRQLGVVVAAVVALGATASAVVLLWERDASSPEAAVEALFSALAAENETAVLDAVVAAERPLLEDPLVQVVVGLGRLGITDAAGGLADWEGSGARVEVEELEVELVWAEGEIAAVDVTGGRLRVVGAGRPDDSERGADRGDGGSPDDVARGVDGGGESQWEVDLADADAQLLVVDGEEGWRVSVLATAVEAVRDGEAGPTTISHPEGPASPEEAVERFYAAAVGDDLVTLASLLAPEEWGALRRHAPAFAEAFAAARSADDDNPSEGRLPQEVEVRELQARVEGDGVTRRVVLEELEVVVGTTVDGDGRISSGVRHSFDGRCSERALIEEPPEGEGRVVPVVRDCSGEAPELLGDAGWGESELAGGRADFPDRAGAEFAHRPQPLSPDPFGVFTVADGEAWVSVIAHEERWYVSAVRTPLLPLPAAAAHLDDGTVRALRDELVWWLGTDDRGEERVGFAEFEGRRLGVHLGATDEPSAVLSCGDELRVAFPGLADVDPYGWAKIMERCLDDGGDLDPDLSECDWHFVVIPPYAPESEWQRLAPRLEQCVADATGDLWMRSPAVSGDVVVVASFHWLRGFDRGSGAERWRTACPEIQWVKYPRASLSHVALVYCNGELTGIDAETGEQRWSRMMEWEPEWLRLGGPLAVMQHDEEGLLVMDVDTGEVLWSLDEASGAVIATGHDGRDDVVVVGDGEELVAYDGRTGERRWREQMPRAVSALGVNGADLYVRTSNWVLYEMDLATGERGERSVEDRWAMIWSDIRAFSDEVLVVASSDEPYVVSAYDLTTLDQLWTMLPWEPEPVQVAADGDLVAVVEPSAREVTVRDHRTGEVLATYWDLVGDVDVADGRVYLVAEHEDGGTVLAALEVR